MKKTASRPEPETVAPDPANVPLPSPQPATRRVLLAEDNEINQELACEMIRFAGCQCDCVVNGQEAVSAATSGRYDLMFMDCMMPGMDGRRGRRLPIVALTAHAMKGDRARCLEAGMDDYLTKPLDPEELARTLAHWMPRPVAPASRPDAIPTETARTTLPPSGIDLAGLLHRCMGKRELAHRLVQKFLAQAGADVHELETAIREQDAVRLRLVAHRLKGSAANVSAEAVRESAGQLEILGRDGNLAAAPELQAQLRVHLEAIKDPTTN